VWESSGKGLWIFDLFIPFFDPSPGPCFNGGINISHKYTIASSVKDWEDDMMDEDIYTIRVVVILHS
jgi:hypothetical protein